MDYSVIIPAYNAAGTIGACVRSLLSQSFPEDVEGEVIVVDDGSDDETASILQRIQSSPKGLQVVTHTSNRGRAAARNSGLKNATGEFFFFLDADMTVESEYVNSHLIYFRQDSGITGVVNRFVAGKDVPDNKFTRYLYRRSRGAAGLGEGGTVPAHQMLIGCTSMRRAVIDRIGGFDENIRVYGGEDTEFAYRIATETESRFIFTERTLVKHNHYRPLARTRELLFEYGRESLPYLVEKYPGIADTIGLHAMGITSVNLPGSSLRTRLFCSKSNELFAQLGYQILPVPLSHPFVKFLLGISLLRGFMEGRDR